ncbi:hypothetical protein AOLI_G00012320 [Acnodon oligacanthus]
MRRRRSREPDRRAAPAADVETGERSVDQERSGRGTTGLSGNDCSLLSPPVGLGKGKLRENAGLLPSICLE